MYKIGVMGDRDSIYGFQSVGLSVFPVENADEGIKILKNIADDFAIIFITERLAEEMDDEIQKYNGAAVPAVIPIPGVSGNTGIGMRNVSRTVEKAVGSDILG